jgi:Cys-tRNA synthase (O-phospho-L-seryl-tRNA:Cys-tRNA synthase)
VAPIHHWKLARLFSRRLTAPATTGYQEKEHDNLNFLEKMEGLCPKKDPNSRNSLYYKELQKLNVPAVYDGLTARIEKCVAVLGLANCAGATAGEWSVAE